MEISSNLVALSRNTNFNSKTCNFRDVVLTQMELLPPVQLLASLPHTPPATPIPTPGQQPAVGIPAGTAVVSAAVPQNLSNNGNSANNSRNSQNLSVTNLNLTNSSNSQIIINPTTNQNPGNNGQQPISTGNSSKFDIEGRYWVKPLFLKVLRKVNGVNPTQVVFSYREVNINFLILNIGL